MQLWILCTKHTSDETIKECIVNEDVINGLADPELVYNSVIGKKTAKKNKDKTA